jgi:hypothetical protein
MWDIQKSIITNTIIWTFFIRKASGDMLIRLPIEIKDLLDRPVQQNIKLLDRGNRNYNAIVVGDYHYHKDFGVTRYPVEYSRSFMGTKMVSGEFKKEHRWSLTFQ